MQKPNLSKLTKKSTKDETAAIDNAEHDALFEMDGLDETSPDWVDGRTPKTFAATQLGEIETEAHQTVQKISAHNDFRPIESVLSQEDTKQNGNGKKKKKTRKVSSKKKHQRKSSTSSISSQSDRAGSEHRGSQPAAIPNAADINFFSDSEVTAAALRWASLLSFYARSQANLFFVLFSHTYSTDLHRKYVIIVNFLVVRGKLMWANYERDELSESPGCSAEMSNLNLNGDNRIPMALSDTAFEVHAASRHA